MKTDLYTKAVLTVIAFALVVIAFNNTKLITEAKAESPNLKSKPNGEALHVIVDEVDRFAYRFCTVNVNVENEVDVKVK